MIGEVEVLADLATAASGARRARPPGAVVDQGMVVIVHRTRQRDVDLGAQRGSDQAVEEGVVGGVGSEQELALSAAAGDQVELALKHLSGDHAVARVKFWARRS